MKLLTNRKLIGLGIIIVIALAMTLFSCSLSQTPPGSNANVEVWLTLADGSKKLAQEANLTFAAGPGAGTVVNVNPNLLYQRLEGVGAAMTDSSAWLIHTKLTTAQREALLNNLFT